MDPKNELKEALSSVKETVESVVTNHKSLQRQVDAIDMRLQGPYGSDLGPPTFAEMLKANESFQRLLHDRRGSAILTLTGKDAAHMLERKTTVTATAAGFQSTGVLTIDRTPGIVPEARQVLSVRDVLAQRPTSMAVVDFVKVSSAMGIASPQVEASTKAENAVTFTSNSEKVRTIATWIPATRQILDDFTELASFLQTSLTYYVNLEEENSTPLRRQHRRKFTPTDTTGHGIFDLAPLECFRLEQDRHHRSLRPRRPAEQREAVAVRPRRGLHHQHCFWHLPRRQRQPDCLADQGPSRTAVRGLD